MSHYESEQGTFKLPTKAFPPVRRTMAEQFNERQEAMQTFAKALYDALILSRKTHKKPYEALWDDCLQRASQTQRPQPRLSEFEIDKIQQILFQLDTQGRQKLCNPLKKYFKKNTLTENEYQVGWEAFVIFDPKNKSVTWSVSENNHACDDAYEAFLAKVFFKALNAVTWTRGTGGMIYYTDENLRDNAMYGEESFTVRNRLGPLGGVKLKKRLRK